MEARDSFQLELEELNMHRKRTYTIAPAASKQDNLVFTDLGKPEDDNDAFKARRARA